ncbi:MAG TPA: response regulator [Chthoniobacteraceae bacterium]|jgi:CheY-like chemotaxis protein
MKPLTTAPLSLHIFLVENHPDTRTYLRMYLEEGGHVVREAEDVAETLRFIGKAACDVLLCDVGLPDGDGWDLLARLRKTNAAPPYAIAMSGFGLSGDRERSKSAGFRHHLVKPFEPEKLDALLEEAARESVGAPGERRRGKKKATVSR